jgi:hypothetical protein
MTKDEILEMARQADVWVAGQPPYQTQLEKFARLVAEKEREECAKACEEEAKASIDDYEAGGMYACAEVIRARRKE